MGNNTSALSCSGELSDCRRSLESAIRLQPELQTCTSNYRVCTNNLVTAQTNYTAMVQQKDQLIQANAQRCATDIANKQENIDELNAEIQDNAVACQQANDIAQATISQLNTDLQTQFSTNEACNTSLNAKEAELSQCNLNLSTTTVDLQTCNVTLNTTNGNLQTCNENLTTTTADLVQRSGEYNQCTSTLSATQGELTTRTTELTQCNNSLISERAMCATNISNLTSQREQLSLELDETQQREEQCNANVLDLMSQMSTLNDRITTLQMDLAAAQSREAQCNSNLGDANKQISALQTTVAALELDIGTCTRNYDQLTIENQNNVKTIAELKALLAASMSTGDQCQIAAAACLQELQVVKFNASNLFFYQGIWAQDAMGNANTNPKQPLVGTWFTSDLTPSPIPGPDMAMFVVTPPLPSGLMISETGALTGTPKQSAPLTEYRIDLMPQYGNTPMIPLATSYVRFAVGDASTCGAPCAALSRCAGTVCEFVAPPIVQSWSTDSGQAQPVEVELGAFPSPSGPVSVYRGDVVPPIGQISTLTGVLAPFEIAVFVTDNVLAEIGNPFEFAIQNSPISMTVSATRKDLTIVQPGLGTWTYTFPQQFVDFQEFKLAIAFTMIIEMGLIAYNVAIALPTADNGFSFDPIPVGVVMAGDVVLNEPVPNYTVTISTKRPMGWYALGMPRQLLNTIDGLDPLRLMPMQLTETDNTAAPLYSTMIGSDTVFLTTGGLDNEMGLIKLVYDTNFNNVELKVSTSSNRLTVFYGVDSTKNIDPIGMQLTVNQQTDLSTGEVSDNLTVFSTDTDGLSQTSSMTLVGTQDMKRYTFYFTTNGTGFIQIRIQEGFDLTSSITVFSLQQADTTSTGPRVIELNWFAPIQVSTLSIM